MTQPLTPTWLIPSAPGQLSNARGSNTGADKLLLQVTYPTAGDNAGTIRAIATRVGRLGGQQTSELAWDSGWMGTPTTSPSPTSQFAGGGFTTAVVVYNGRVYVADTGTTAMVTAGLFSAAYSGGSVGSWRKETSIAFPAATTAISMALVFNYGQPLLYVVSQARDIVFAPILSEGFIGAWTTSLSAAKPTQAGALFGNQATSSSTQGWLGMVGAQSGSGLTATAATTVQNAGLNADGTIVSWATGTVLPAARANFGLYLDGANNFVLVAGGYDGANTCQTTIYIATLGALGAITAWSTQTHVLPVAKQGLGILVENGYIFALGGSTNSDATGGTSTLHSAVLATNVTTGQVGVWSAALTPALPIAMTYGAWFLAGPLGAGAYSYLAVTASETTGSALTATTYENRHSGTGTLVNGAWNNGSSSLTVGNLGTGGVLTTNQDGSQTVTFLYQAFGTPAVLTGGFTDGDRVQWTVQFTDQANGDPSPLSLPTLIKIGQPPTISGVTWSNTSGKPTLSFTYLPGPGEGPCA